MIDRAALLSDLQKLLTKLEADLLERSESSDVPDVGATLRAEFERAKKAERTAQNYEDWRSDAITQASAAWVLACVFVRFLEDNRLIDPPKIAGPTAAEPFTAEPRPSGSGSSSTENKAPLPDGRGSTVNRLQRARDEHELYFREHPTLTDRDYLLSLFDDLAQLPGTRDLFGEHNPIRELPNWLSGDAAGELLKFFQKIDANSGLLVHDFTDSNWDTRFLGDLYQDLSEAARKKYALLQTPEFVEEFILERTLEPALEEFGLVIGGLSHGTNGTDGTNENATNPMRPITPIRPINAGANPNDNCFKMIDPACGSGHFLLGSFRRILDRWQRREPGTKVRELVQRTLDSVHGVDVNPFAIAIARFRLLLAAMRACGIARLADAPAFRLNLVCGDSLLHAPLAAGGKKYTAGQQELDFALASDPEDSDECDHAYRSENLPELKRLLRGGQYHAVVANPPYIVPKDRQLNERYRKRFKSCHMKYSLSVPFMERIFRLAVPGGYTGQITSNSFMKREFGKKLIEEFFPTVDLTHVIDTKGAFIPGHATPTVILFGRHRLPVASTLRTVMGIRGEPETPGDPSKGQVWMSIRLQVDQPGSQGDFVSATDSPRTNFHKHPWSLGGGGAAELKELMDSDCSTTLDSLVLSVGIASFTLEDDAYTLPVHTARSRGIPKACLRTNVMGDSVRDWQLFVNDVTLFPYDDKFLPLRNDPTHPCLRFLWVARTSLANNKMFAGRTKVECGLHWYEFGRLTAHKLMTPLSIVFANIATHFHAYLDRGGSLFNTTSPLIKLRADATEDEHLLILGYLDSSAACFCMKQVSHEKQMMGGESIRIESKAKVPYAYSSTQLGKLPIPEAMQSGALRKRLIELSRRMDSLAGRLGTLTPINALSRGLVGATSIRDIWNEFERERLQARSQMVLLQEEIDFTVYAMWGFADRSLLSVAGDWPEVALDAGQRPFEILRGRSEDDFPVLERVPSSWPKELRDLWQRRMDAITGSPELRLIEDPHYKRRWIGRQGKYNLKRDDNAFESACVEWLLDRLESYFDFDGRMNDACQSTAKLDIALVSVAKLADVARQDAEFQQVGELYRDDPAFDVQKLVEELVAAECVPLLPVLRYKPTGLRKRAEWEKTWDLQREEDRLTALLEPQVTQLKAWRDEFDQLTESLKTAKGEDADHLKNEQEVLAGNIRNLTPIVAALTAERDEFARSIPVPPKYDSKDFLDSTSWRLRGKLDVPKERWISFPHSAGPDGTLVIAWAGYDHLQQAKAISAYYVEIQERLGGRDDPRLIPLLAGMLELLPWLKQWHNDPDATFDGMRMGDYFESFVTEEARQLNKTIPEIKAWEPPAKTKKKATAKK